MLRLVRSALLLSLLAAVGGLASPALAQEGAAHVELILDASGSMFNKLADGRYRIVAAKEVLAELVAALPAGEGLNVGFRAYGSELRAVEAGACQDSRLYVPIEGVERQLLLDTVKSTQARGATPIAYSLERALEDLAARAGKKLVVLITDGEESCGGDVRAAAQALQAAGIDLRIIGFDLDAIARASFEGVGAFVNATSAAELLAALNRAVEEAAAPAAPAAYPVTVTLTREGEPATAGPAVAFQPALGEAADAEPFAPAGDSFRAELPAGTYVARVSDALSGEPLLVGGLVVTPEGPNEFAFELAPRLSVTLTPATSTPNAGATLAIAWAGAPEGAGYIALTAGDDATLLHVHAAGASGEAKMRLPAGPGDYELRYLVDQPNGAVELLGLTPITLQPVSASLEAPAQVDAGSWLEVAWEGPDNVEDFVTLVPADAPDGTWAKYATTSDGNPLRLRAPESAGAYELRYLDGAENVTLAARPLLAVAAEVAFEAPGEAPAGSIITIEVTRATGNRYDYITILPPGAPEDTWTTYVDIDGPGTYELRTLAQPGEYELRYATESAGLTLLSSPITLTAVTASLEAPAVVTAGEAFEVHWQGPAYSDDYLTIVPASAPEGEWAAYEYTSAGSPLWLTAPDEPGQYEVRYMSGQTDTTLASRAVQVR